MTKLVKQSFHGLSETGPCPLLDFTMYFLGTSFGELEKGNSGSCHLLFYLL